MIINVHRHRIDVPLISEIKKEYNQAPVNLFSIKS
jgi:hypothetical protein